MSQISKGYTHYTVGQHQTPTKNPQCFEQSPGKKEQSNGFPGSERLKIPLI